MSKDNRPQANHPGEPSVRRVTLKPPQPQDLRPGRRIGVGIVAESHPDTLTSPNVELLTADLVLPPLATFPQPITLTNFGKISSSGPNGAAVRLIFWGDAWNLPTTTPSMISLVNDVQSILSGPWRAGLRQYGIGRIPYGGSIVIENESPPQVIQPPDVESVVTRVRDGMFPGRQDLFVVMMPPGTTWGPNLIPTNIPIRGAHTATLDFVDLTPFWYAYVLTNTEAQMTATFSHELAEMLTDPEPPSGWVMTSTPPANNPPNNTLEIGDMCNGIKGVLSGVTVQYYWSVADNACLLSQAFPLRQTLRLAGITLAGKGMRSIQDPIPSLNALTDRLFGGTL